MKRSILVVVVILSVANIASAEIIRDGIDIDFVTIGDPGNAGDTRAAASPSGCGAVGYTYHLGKYEVTNGQWDAFVSEAGAPTGNPNNAYDESATWTGTDVPTNEVSWYEAAQFCNYLTTGDKSLGAYQFSGNNTNPGDFTGIDRGSAVSTYGMVYVIPTEDEWYKAAYYTGSGYSTYANGTDTAPIEDVDSNYDDYESGAQPWDFGDGTQEQNGTFDMMGNVWEWNETLISSSPRGLRGGSYITDDYGISSSYRILNFPGSEYYDLGFRVASVSDTSAPPVADTNGPYALYAGDTLTLDASGSTDDENDITSYVWDLDDDGFFETDAGTEAIVDVSYAYLESLGIGIGVDYYIYLKVTDGDEQADTDTTTLTIEPEPALVIAVDIKPESCPNPFNVNSKGVLPVAIPGSETVDVYDIDVDSIQLAGVSPIRSNYEDVATGLVDPIECECSTEGPDGYIDLTLKFEIQAIADALGEAADGDEFILYLTGYLYDGTAIEGSDCIIVRRKGRR